MSVTRKKYIIANWKMNFTPGEASLFLNKLEGKIKPTRSFDIVLSPSLISLQPLSIQINRRQFKLAAQNFYWRDFGAYTGEVAISQLRGIVDYALVGHSERRHIFGETDKDIRDKVAAAIRNNVTPVLCIGETADERTFGETNDVLYDQLVGGLTEVSAEDITKVVIAYEPVWAISTTGNAKIAAPDDIADAIVKIRAHIERLYGAKTAEKISVLYGGSVNPNNAASYLSVKGVDGLLIGGASLVADSFNDIIEVAKKVINE